MAKRNLLSNAFNESSEQSTDPHPTFLTLTPKTIRLGYGSEVFPLRNITRIGKYKVLEAKFPLFLVIVLALAGLGSLVTFSVPGLLFAVLFLGGAGYGFWQRMQPKTFAFGFETNAGSIRHLHVQDEAFVTKVVEVVTSYIESEQEAGLVINVEDRSIKNVGFIGGHVQTGDSK